VINFFWNQSKQKKKQWFHAFAIVKLGSPISYAYVHPIACVGSRKQNQKKKFKWGKKKCQPNHLTCEPHIYLWNKVVCFVIL
jgi:hypothetical protein